IYRTFHMIDPQAFYNKEDLWDLASYAPGQGGQKQPVSPTYVVATLPGSDTPEFLLLTSFVPRLRDNLIGMMLARCDGENLGEIAAPAAPQPVVAGQAQQAPAPGPDSRIERIRTHLRRYRELSSQGKWSEAGKELEALESEARQ